VRVHTGLASLCAYRLLASHYPLPRLLNLCVSPLTGATPFLLAQERCAKEGHPDIRVSLRSTSLAPAPLRGPAYKGRPWPFKPLAASMRLAPLRNTSTRPPHEDHVASLRHLRKIKVGSVWLLLLKRDLADDAQVPLQEAEWNHYVRG